MYSIRRKIFSQNFLHNRKLVSSLVGKSSIGKNDLVIEIGPGKGIITEALVHKANHVVAVEIDRNLYNHLNHKFLDTKNLTLLNQDFLHYQLPRLPYKVFANIPFSIEGKIIRKLLDDSNPPQDSYLVVMKQLAVRLSGTGRENMFTALHKPWFEFSISHHFSSYDFRPVPSVQAVLFRFTQRKQPLLPVKHKRRYQQFIKHAFTNGQPLKHTLKPYYSREQIYKALHQLSINQKTKPGQLTINQWIKLYQALLD